MNRRDFIKLAGMAGMTVVSPMAFGRIARAEEMNYPGPYYVMVNAIGGWDTTYLCDPKGVNGINTAYGQGEIGTIASSPIKYAPVGNNQYFFEKYASELLVINGVDMATTGHAVGERYAWTGSLENPEYPTFAALAAAAHAPNLPLSYLSYGGHDATGALLPLTRVSNVSHLKGLADPDHKEGFAHKPYHAPGAAELIQQAVDARHAAGQDHSHLPSERAARSSLFTARMGAKELSRIRDHLPTSLPRDNEMKAQAMVALAAFKAGLSVAVNLVLNGFDSHAQNDTVQLPKLQLVLDAVDFLLEEAETMGLRDQIVVVMASDFGRTPNYNSDQGKDHWAIGSMMALGPGIRGNRVLGATDEEQRPFNVNPTTLELEYEGVRLRPEHVHRALRRHAGLADHPLAGRFELKEDDLDIFS
ncbi:Tat pathway signal protein [Lujinxingia litoralis]|uniref:Tat pathway signal protein n=1 Tax=Lujinxingia litoralis TaxID=2211119 RepID=A0A328C8B6_9DELT|nr:DUF1501 domain-containing protein [Lujinxingia litoralis]RAL24665.1 Tat pathway signal protein [Lujinxingia litoralis]